MDIVLLTALGVGGSTVFGALVGLIFKNISRNIGDAVLGFAAGVMLAASIWGLIIPAVECGGRYGFVIAIAGIFVGAFFLRIIGKLVPQLHKLLGADSESKSTGRVLLFVMAIALHNLPEGIAAGVGFGTENTVQAIFIAGGIALQNIPEGMVIIAPMLASGISVSKTFLCALFTGLIEVIGTFIGYFAISFSSAILPFALSFAAGTMLYVISDEMIPETHTEDSKNYATYALLLGFCLMLMTSCLLNS